ncbi:MAG: hypothetical protein ACK41T_00215 [Pseudobdellovibrio sp.]
MRPDIATESFLKLEDIHCYEKTENTFQKAFVALQCNCVLCSTPLKMKISPTQDNQNNEIKEEAFCPQCNIRMRSKNHTLQ